MTESSLSNDLDVITEEINELAEKVGISAWKIGRAVLGPNATAKQISNYLYRTDFGIPGGLEPDMILNFMMRVNPQELP